MKLAAIDVGTNSIHTIIAEVHGDGTFQVVDQFKEMVRLGTGETDKAGLTPRAITDGLGALVKAKTICENRRVEEIIAVATSAVREAKNGGSFIEQVLRETGIAINVITTAEEARLIYLGVRESIDLGARRALIIDIGGGSIEFIIADQKGLQFTASVKLGVLRLLNRFPISDPVKPKEIDGIENYIGENSREVLSQVRAHRFDCVIVTSGTTLELLALVLNKNQKAETPDGALHNQVVSASKLQMECAWLLKSSTADRRRMNSIPAGRLDSIVMGAALWQYFIPELKIAEVIGCSFALREGMMVDYLRRHMPGIRQEEKYPNPRQRSVLTLAQRCNWEEAHSRQVAALALSIFDQLETVHRLGANARELLEFACWLHDIGYHINAKSHHKHGAYLVNNGDLLGMAQPEIQMIAAIVRYHRKRKPRERDLELRDLTAPQRRTVEILAGILRIADGLDRTHFGVVQRVIVTSTENVIQVRVVASVDAQLEIGFAAQKADLLEDALGKSIRVRLVEGEASAENANPAPRTLIEIPRNGKPE